MKYVRDQVQYPLLDDYFQQRIAAGWRLRVVEWEQGEKSESVTAAAEVPYGLEIDAGTLHMVENPQEITVLLTILEMVVKDQSVPAIADELNRRQLSNRQGQLWTAPAVFDLLPRVIEMGPTLLQSREWRAIRPTVRA